MNLATPIDFSAATAARQATVVAGDARFEVLRGGLIRMEYSPSGTFDDAPTVNVGDRRFAVPFYRTSTGQWLAYDLDLRGHPAVPAPVGPFGPANTSVS